MVCEICGCRVGDSHRPECRYWTEPEPPYADQWATTADLDDLADQDEDHDTYLNPRRFA